MNIFLMCSVSRLLGPISNDLIWASPGVFKNNFFTWVRAEGFLVLDQAADSTSSDVLQPLPEVPQVKSFSENGI